jgi:hypothetical protein
MSGDVNLLRGSHPYLSTRISSIPALASYSIDNCGGQHALMQKFLRVCLGGGFGGWCIERAAIDALRCTGGDRCIAAGGGDRCIAVYGRRSMHCGVRAAIDALRCTGGDRCIAVYGRARGHRPYEIWGDRIRAIRKNRCRGSAPVPAPTPSQCTALLRRYHKGRPVSRNVPIASAAPSPQKQPASQYWWNDPPSAPDAELPAPAIPSARSLL